MRSTIEGRPLLCILSGIGGFENPGLGNALGGCYHDDPRFYRLPGRLLSL